MRNRSLVAAAVAAALAAALAVSACSGDAALQPGAATTGAAVSTAPPPGGTDPVVPGGPFAPDPETPAGAGYSFNESAGCPPSAQGIRGPYATVSGDLGDSEAIRGPWGDVFGRDLAAVRANLVEVALPMSGEDPATVWIHRAALPAFEAAVANLEREEAAGNRYEIRPGDVGGFRPATVPPKRYLSFHSVGTAIDINTTTNPYSAENELITDMPDWFVEAWTDAGWCWGGDWQTIKDPMHFSWQGPMHTAGYPQQAPAPPRTDPEPFRRSIAFETSLGPAAHDSRPVLADADRDGAVDAIRLRPWTAEGGLGVVVSQAIYAYRTGCTPLITSPVDPAAVLLMADGDADGRADLWEIGTSAAGVTVTIHTHSSGFSERLRPRETGVDPSGEETFLAGDHDRDGRTDLYVVRPGTVEVWAGPGFTERILDAPLPEGSGPRFALGDYDVDGVPDLFALGSGTSAVLTVMAGSGDLRGEPAVVGTGVGPHDGAFAAVDVDGDGRDDLVFLDSDGTLTAYLGGDAGAATDAALTSWFVEGYDQPTTRQEACPEVPGSRG
jgi:hypothetical protein